MIRKGLLVFSCTFEAARDSICPIYFFHRTIYYSRFSIFLLLSRRPAISSTDDKLGTTWFLQHTIVFSIAYAFACGHGWYPKGKCPSLLDFFGIAMVLGMIGSVLPLFFPQTETVVTVPNV